MTNEFSTSSYPSLHPELLKDFLGQKVAKLLRYSWWPAKEVALECDIRNELSFSFTAGPLAVVFENGCILGVASAPSLNSIVVWLDHIRDTPLSKDEELFPISCDDEVYADCFWKQFIGATLLDFSIFKRRTINAIQECLPSEVGLLFIFEENLEFIASYNLHDESPDDFSVLDVKQIKQSIYEDLEKIPLL